MYERKKYSHSYIRIFFYTNADEIDIEIFDLLMSLGDFSEFKTLMLSHKKAKLAENNGESPILTVFGTQMTGVQPTQTSLEKSV